MTINEVAPPGFGHTKGDKKKGVKKGGTAAAFDRARKEGRFKGSKSDMFAIMWSQKNKGDKPHYKPGTDKKYKKYQSEGLGATMVTTAGLNAVGNIAKAYGASQAAKGAIIGGALSGGGAVVGGALNYAASRNKKSDSKKKKYKKYQESVENGKVDLTLKPEVNNVLKQQNKDYDRGLLAQVNKDGSYDVAYWYDKYKAYPVEVEVDGKSIKKDAKNIHIKYHPELKKKDDEKKKQQDESFEIDRSAHKAAQKKQKMRNLAKGNTNPNEKAAAEKKAGGPKLMGEGKRWDSYKKAVSTVLGKKKEKKAEKATDAGARAKRKLQRKVHAKYVSGSEDLVPDEMRD